MLSAHLKATAAEIGSGITFPPSTAQKRVLPNGLTIIVQEDRSAPVASVQAWCGTGSVDENEHLGAGLSNILEHMLFKGTKTNPANAIAQKVQDMGGYINAYTSFDRTVFWIDVPKDGTTVALEVLCDAMINSTLPAEEYAKEQEVIRREFAMGMDDPDRMAGQLLFATAYQRHPYRLPVIGLLDVYNQLTREDVLQYYRARYVPNNLTFIVFGDVSAEELAKAKKISLSHHLGALTTMRGQASDIGSNWFLTRNLNFTRDYLEAVQKISADDVRRVAGDYLIDDHLTVISLNPKRAAAAKTESPPSIAAGEIQKIELSNGLRVLVREDPRLPLVSIAAVFRGGLLAETA